VACFGTIPRNYLPRPIKLQRPKCSRAAPKPSIATVSADYLSLGLSLFTVTLDDKINLKLKEYSRHELYNSLKDNLVDIIDKEQRCNARTKC